MTIGENTYSAYVSQITVNAEEVSAKELLEQLSNFADLKKVQVVEGRYQESACRELRNQYPDIQFVWPVKVCGEIFSSASSQIVFSEDEVRTAEDVTAIFSHLDEFYQLKLVDVGNVALSNEEMYAFSQQLNGIQLAWNITLYNTQISSIDSEIDISNNQIRDNAEALEDIIAFMPNLEKVRMCQCGLSNEFMETLCAKYPEIRFVWMVFVQNQGLPTDTTWYIPYYEDALAHNALVQTPYSYSFDNLKYFPDMEALDLGHSGIGDISFLSNMPHLKYLILAESYVTDLSVVSQLKELEWLELFLTDMQDITPLKECTALRDLNICYITTPGDNVFETVSQMPWLKRLWCSGTFMSDEQLEQLEELLPNTEIYNCMGDESTGFTWRFYKDYYDMRDAFHMYYMDIKGNTTTHRYTNEELQEEFYTPLGKTAPTED